VWPARRKATIHSGASASNSYRVTNASDKTAADHAGRDRSINQTAADRYKAAAVSVSVV